MQHNYMLSEAGYDAISDVLSTLSVVADIAGSGKFFPQLDSHELSDFMAAQRNQLKGVLDGCRQYDDGHRKDVQAMISQALVLMRELLDPGTHTEAELSDSFNALVGRSADDKALMTAVQGTFARLMQQTGAALAERAAAPAKPAARKRAKLAAMPAPEVA